jgi:hypothetical protein
MWAIRFAAWSPGGASRFGLLFVLVAAMGCGSPRVKLSGQVRYNGDPLPGGRVTFRPADPRENSVSAELDERGNYEAVLPAGEVTITVDNRELEPRGGAHASRLPSALPFTPDVRAKLSNGKPPEPAEPKPADATSKQAHGRYVKIPERYHMAETSGLQFVVEREDQIRNIELTK